MKTEKAMTTKQRVLSLTVLERMALIKLLPSSGNLVTMGVSEEVFNIVRMTSDEMEGMGLKENQAISKEFSNEQGTKDFNISNTVYDLLKKQADDTDKSGGVTMANIDLIRKINAL